MSPPRRIAPLVVGTTTVRFAERSREVFVAGTTPELLEIRHIELGSGRYLPGGDEARAARVAVLGSKIATELFPGANPLGDVMARPPCNRGQILQSSTGASVRPPAPPDRMARPLRLLVENGHYHVTSRSWDRSALFRDDEHRLARSAQDRGHLLVARRHPRARVDDEQHEIRVMDREAGLLGDVTGEPAGGSAAANADRWVGQFDEAGQKTAKRSERTSGAFKTTIVEVEGTFAAGSMMGPSTPKTGYALYGAIVETSGSSHFFKLTGPSATGSLNGTPSSRMPTPPRSSARAISTVRSGLGSPAVR